MTLRRFTFHLRGFLCSNWSVRRWFWILGWPGITQTFFCPGRRSRSGREPQNTWVFTWITDWTGNATLRLLQEGIKQDLVRSLQIFQFLQEVVVYSLEDFLERVTCWSCSIRAGDSKKQNRVFGCLRAGDWLNDG